MTTFVRVKDVPFMRDMNSMGLSNTDMTARKEYQSKVNMVRIQKQELNNVKQEIDILKTDMLEIKMLLSKLLEK